MKNFSIVLAALAAIVIAAPPTASAMDKEGRGNHHKMHHKMKHHRMHHEKMMKHDKM